VSESTTRPVEEERTRIAAGVYGTVLVLAVLSYLSEDDQLGKGDVFAAMLGTGLAYFAAHVYVDYLAARMTGARESTIALSRKVFSEEWPLLNAMIAPGIPLLLGGVGVFSRSTAVDIALVVAFVNLVGYGFEAGRRSYGSWLGGLVSATVAVALGTIVIELKNLLH
jgi:hypothetical protein